MDTITDTFTLEDTILTTLGPGNFLVATQAEAEAIADAAADLGHEAMAGRLAWFLSRTDETFVRADALLVALRAGRLKTHRVFA